ncbi:hypothetical protein ElyMa_001917500 [Elysia marginata]|uniref:Uncharacterized protein n=1 Tax=Elysia marginata TaxID=1093978 RepID=A0AAV4EV84_9GAST|nr:hypothetical protein ElyMa_001917500 [Elysia marginata]
MRRIISIHWLEIISNTDLRERTQQQSMEVEMRRKWRWIGHTLRKPRQCITRHSLVWNPQGRRARGRPIMTLRRETEAEMASAEKTWKELEEVSQDWMVWRTFVGGLCFPGSLEAKKKKIGILDVFCKESIWINAVFSFFAILGLGGSMLCHE